MDFQTRFAVFTAIGVASFSAGLSLTTACQRHEAEPEKLVIHPALPKPEPVAPTAPVAPEKASAKPLAPVVAPEPSVEANAERKPLAADRLTVRRLVATHLVREREPIEPAELVVGSPVLAFVELANEDDVERNVVVTFEREGQPTAGHVKLHVAAKSPRFRTWARTQNLGVSGTWEVVVRAEDGTELGRQPFELLAMLDPA